MTFEIEFQANHKSFTVFTMQSRLTQNNSIKERKKNIKYEPNCNCGMADCKRSISRSFLCHQEAFLYLNDLKEDVYNRRGFHGSRLIYRSMSELFHAIIKSLRIKCLNSEFSLITSA